MEIGLRNQRCLIWVGTQTNCKPPPPPPPIPSQKAKQKQKTKSTTYLVTRVRPPGIECACMNASLIGIIGDGTILLILLQAILTSHLIPYHTLPYPTLQALLFTALLRANMTRQAKSSHDKKEEPNFKTMKSLYWQQQQCNKSTVSD
jgi:hypothetical protein